MIGELTAHVWQSTWFAVAAGLLTVAFRKNRAKVRYCLWLSASLKFLVPFSLLMSLGSHLGWAPAAQKITTPDVSFAMERITQPFSGSLSFVPAAPGVTNWSPIAILGVWMCGFVAIALIRLRSWLRIRAALRTSTPLEIPAEVEIRSSPGLLEPGVVGLLRPVLLLPEGIVECLTPPQLEAVLAHELCHVRRRDNLFASIHMIVEAMFWFHPLVWWIGARLIEERERACDEGVLSLGSEPRIYADAILNVCKLYVESPLVCVSGVTGANLKGRIEAIMTNRTGQGLNRAKKLLLASAGVAALAGPVVIGVVIGIGHAPVVRAQSPTAIPSVVQTAQAATASAVPVRYPDRRLVAILFDFGTMTSDEQSRARQSAIDFVQNRVKPANVVAIMAADNGKVAIVQDFTDDQVVLESAILKLSAREGNGSVPGVGPKLSSIEAATKLLAVFPEKKALMYFSGGVTQSGVGHQAELLNVIDTAKKSNVAFYPIDVRGTAPQIIRSDSPPPLATYEGAPGVVATLTEALSRERQGRGEPVAANPIAGLPGRHASFQIYPAGEFHTLSVPLDSLSGVVDILGEIKMRLDTGAAGQNVAAVRDSIQASAGTFRANFTLSAGSYVCGLIVRERATGRMYGETIDFEVK